MDIEKIYEAAEIEGAISDPDVAHLVINKDEVVGLQDLPGLSVETEQIENGIDISINLDEGTVIEDPVHLCFGVTEEEAVQNIEMDIDIEKDAEIGILAHCVFPQARDVKHIMNADIRIGPGADYTYLEKHIHSPEGGIKVVPKADIILEEGASFRTDFELLEGRVGMIDIDYETTAKKDSVLEMMAKIDGQGDDEIKISENGNLVGENSKGVLTTRVALRDEAEAEVYNKLEADAPNARGHVDCKEIIQGDGRAKAVPIVDVQHPEAHVTHEAAIGSVDTKQLQTLMARGLSEDESADLIIDGLLS